MTEFTAPREDRSLRGPQSQASFTAPREDRSLRGPQSQASFTVLLYSDDPQVRQRMMRAIGTRPAKDLSVRFVESSTYAQTVRIVDDQDVDLLVLDGEAAPAGGLGIARQLKDEVADAPPTCVVIARAADRWLAAYAKVDATLVHPLDPVTTGQTVAALLRTRAGMLPTVP
jgi:DNA-binding response OmpR family regulator